MEHPLIPSIDNLTPDELMSKITELNNKLGIAYRLANHDLCNQLRMAIETYQNKYTEKIRKPPDEGNDFSNMIDIK
jgi:hypothetical protein